MDDKVASELVEMLIELARVADPDPVSEFRERQRFVGLRECLEDFDSRFIPQDREGFVGSNSGNLLVGAGNHAVPYHSI